MPRVIMIFLPSHFYIAQNWLKLLIDDRQWSNITKLEKKKEKKKKKP